MENPYKRMQRSLTQSAVLGVDVLRRARRREGTSQVPSGEPGPEDDKVSVCQEFLEEAFSTMALFLRHSSEQCKKYHLRVPVRNLSEQEVSHVHRFHCRNPPRTAFLQPHKQDPLPGQVCRISEVQPRGDHSLLSDRNFLDCITPRVVRKTGPPGQFTGRRALEMSTLKSHRERIVSLPVQWILRDRLTWCTSRQDTVWI